MSWGFQAFVSIKFGWAGIFSKILVASLTYYNNYFYFYLLLLGMFVLDML